PRHRLHLQRSPRGRTRRGRPTPRLRGPRRRLHHPTAPPLPRLDPRPRPRPDRPPDPHPPRRQGPRMTVHDAHTRLHLDGPGGLQVPFTRVALTNGETFDRYATEGPGSDPEVGLPRLRDEWLTARGDLTSYDGRETQLVDNGRAAIRRGQAQEEWRGAKAQPRKAMEGHTVTQMHYARQGIVTPEMEF